MKQLRLPRRLLPETWPPPCNTLAFYHVPSFTRGEQNKLSKVETSVSVPLSPRAFTAFTASVEQTAPIVAIVPRAQASIIMARWAMRPVSMGLSLLSFRRTKSNLRWNITSRTWWKLCNATHIAIACLLLIGSLTLQPQTLMHFKLAHRLSWFVHWLHPMIVNGRHEDADHTNYAWW